MSYLVLIITYHFPGKLYRTPYRGVSMCCYLLSWFNPATYMCCYLFFQQPQGQKWH